MKGWIAPTFFSYVRALSWLKFCCWTFESRTSLWGWYGSKGRCRKIDFLTRELKLDLSILCYRASLETSKNIYFVGGPLESQKVIGQKVTFWGSKIELFWAITFFKNFLKINGRRIRFQHLLEHHITYFSQYRFLDPFLKGYPFWNFWVKFKLGITL